GRRRGPLRERIPGRAVYGGNRVARGVERGHERHAVQIVGIEVDARDVACDLPVGVRRAGFVGLEHEVCAVIVIGVGALLIVENEVGVLVGLGLVGLDVVAD